MNVKIERLSTRRRKVGVALVWGLLPALMLVWFVYGVVGGNGYFQGWRWLHVFVWVWLTFSIQGILPGSVRETKANMSMLTALTGFLLPLPGYLHLVFPVPDNSYVPNSYTPPVSYSFLFTEPIWSALTLVVGLTIGVWGTRRYVALTRSEVMVESEAAESGPSVSIIGGIKRRVASVIKTVAPITLAVVPGFVFAALVEFFQEGNPLTEAWSGVNFALWIWVAVAILGLMSGSLKKRLARLSLLTGLGGVLLACTIYVNFVSALHSPGIGASGLVAGVFYYSIFYAYIPVLGFLGYLVLRRPKTFEARKSIIVEVDRRE